MIARKGCLHMKEEKSVSEYAVSVYQVSPDEQFFSVVFRLYLVLCCCLYVCFVYSCKSGPGMVLMTFGESVDGPLLCLYVLPS